MGQGVACHPLDACLSPSGGRSYGTAGAREYDAPIGTRPAASVGGPAPKVTGRKRALLIGINYEGSRAQLKGCHNDVKSMSNLLSRQYGFQVTDLRIMMDDRRSEMPTRVNIISGVNWLVQGAQPGDCLFFHFSGHGAQQQDPRGAEEDCMDETILPVDFQSAGQIVDNEIFEAMCATLPSGVKLTAVMDCCHSGTGLDLPFKFDPRRRSWIEDDNPCHSEGDVQLFSGCEDHQTSADVQSLYCQARGAMTSAFCETLTRDPVPEYAKFLQGLHSHLQRNGHSQRPQLTSSQRFDTSRPFEMCAGIVPNGNPEVGRHFRKRKHPKTQWLSNDDPLGDMLAGEVIGDVLFGGILGGGLLGGMFGGYDGFGSYDGYGGYGGYGGFGDNDGFAFGDAGDGFDDGGFGFDD